MVNKIHFLYPNAQLTEKNDKGVYTYKHPIMTCWVAFLFAPRPAGGAAWTGVRSGCGGPEAASGQQFPALGCDLPATFPGGSGPVMRTLVFNPDAGWGRPSAGLHLPTRQHCLPPGGRGPWALQRLSASWDPLS